MVEMKEALLEAMEIYFQGDSKRINHAHRVTGYAEDLLERERGDYPVVIGASVLHDIGIHQAEKKYGSASGHYQEIEGPPIARSILAGLQFEPAQIEEICKIIAHHHSPGKVNTQNFKILYDADWLVNLGDECDIRDRNKLSKTIERIFLTPSGKSLAKEIYLGEVGCFGHENNLHKEGKMATKFDPIAEFRNDHRRVRDLLLSLAEAIEKGQLEKARTTLGEIDTLVGPHFRYEEEALYPTLKQFLGEYVDSLVEEHDGAIGTAKTAASLLAKPSISPEEAKAAAKAARFLLVHVSNCDGLNILAERLTPAALDDLGAKYEASRRAGLPLLKWADTVRSRKAA